ncbi:MULTISPECIES: hypothetical protein [unclassified Knoellia]|uniref:hypothetical protein n=1 Tax=Knoellia altitudinis TaxID=3404795 RepID=UPI003605B33A
MALTGADRRAPSGVGSARDVVGHVDGGRTAYRGSVVCAGPSGSALPTSPTSTWTTGGGGDASFDQTYAEVGLALSLVALIGIGLWTVWEWVVR